MSRGKDSRAERVARETERLLKEGRKEIRQLDLSKNEARRNIRNFLEHLPEFQQTDQRERPTDRSP